MPDVVTLPWVIVPGDAPELAVTARTLRGRAFGQVRRGVWVPTGTDVSAPDVRIAAVAAQLPAHSVIGGWSAARMHERATSSDDLEVFDGQSYWEEPRRATGSAARATAAPRSGARVMVCAARSSRLTTRDDVRVFRSVVPADEVCETGGIHLTTPLRTAFDMARLLSPTRAVIAVDRMLHLHLVNVGDLRALALERRGWRGAAAAQVALSLADGGAASPQETILRLLWTGAGLPRPRCNPVIRRPDGRFVARVDLLDGRAGVVGEYDGSYHASSVRRSDDARRQAELERLGLVVVRATADDVEDRRRSAWQERLRMAYRRAAGRTERAWIVTEH